MTDKVLPMVRKKKEPEEKVQEPNLDLEAVMKTNEANKERIAKERLNANKKVLKSYRLK